MTLQTLATCDVCGTEQRESKIGTPDGWSTLEGSVFVRSPGDVGSQKRTFHVCTSCATRLVHGPYFVNTLIEDEEE